MLLQQAPPLVALHRDKGAAEPYNSDTPKSNSSRNSQEAKKKVSSDFRAGNQNFVPLNIGLEQKLNRVDLSGKARRFHWC